MAEAKISTDLGTEQVQRYLKIAKDLKIDAFVTISNQFVISPTVSPCSDLTTKDKKNISIFHWSYLETEAKVQLSKSAVSDPDQAYLLSEYVRFLEHTKTGVSEFKQVSTSWVELCKAIQGKNPIEKKSPLIDSVVSDWNELTRCTSLRLSRSLGTNVTFYTTSKERKDPLIRVQALRRGLEEGNLLQLTLNVPYAAAPIVIEASLESQSVIVSMEVSAPLDRKRASACVNWLLRQLSDSEGDAIDVEAKWPGRNGDTFCNLAKLRDNVDEIAKDRKGLLPKAFVIKIVSRLGTKFTQRQNFVSEFVGCVESFYSEVGQYILPWQAPPPKPTDILSSNEEC